MVSHLLQRRRGARRETVADGLRLKEHAEAGGRRRGRRARTSKPSPALSILEQRAGELRRPQGRRAGHRRRRRRRCSRRLKAALEAEGAMLEARRAEGRRRRGERRHLASTADEKLDGGPSVLFDAVAVLAVAGRAQRCWPRTRRRAISSPTPSRTASSSPTRRPPRRCCEKAGVLEDRTRASCRSTRPATPTASSPPAASCASGSARPRSSRSDRRPPTPGWRLPLRRAPLMRRGAAPVIRGLSGPERSRQIAASIRAPFRDSTMADAPARPAPIRLADYRPPDWLIDAVELDFRLGEAGTEVAARLALRRNPAAGDGARPLVLDGQELELLGACGRRRGARRQPLLGRRRSSDHRGAAGRLHARDPGAHPSRAQHRARGALRLRRHLLHPVRARGLPQDHLLPRTGPT